MKVTQICYWIVGRSISIDLHAADGSLIRPTGFDEPIMVEIPATSTTERESRGLDVCIAIALSHGLDKTAVSYDPDSFMA